MRLIGQKWMQVRLVGSTTDDFLSQVVRRFRSTWMKCLPCKNWEEMELGMVARSAAPGRPLECFHTQAVDAVIVHCQTPADGVFVLASPYAAATVAPEMLEE